MAEQEKPQGPKRRSSKQGARAAKSGAVATNSGAAKPPRPPRHHVQGAGGAARSPERTGGAKPAPSTPSTAETKARGWMADLNRYLKSVKAEFLRVTWPGRQELKVATMVVVATLFVLTLYLFIVNQVFTAVFSRLGG